LDTSFFDSKSHFSEHALCHGEYTLLYSCSYELITKPANSCFIRNIRSLRYRYKLLKTLPVLYLIFYLWIRESIKSLEKEDFDQADYLCSRTTNSTIGNLTI
jgi:hypothetical protein